MGFEVMNAWKKVVNPEEFYERGYTAAQEAGSIIWKVCVKRFGGRGLSVPVTRFSSSKEVR
jgi:hypothetical protein